jgi:hypothetical protein
LARATPYSTYASSLTHSAVVFIDFRMMAYSIR